MRPQPEKNDLVYLLTILESLGKLIIYRHGYDEALRFYKANDQLNFNASLLLLANIGEQAGKVSETTKQKNIQVAWRDIKDFRNRVVHDYVGIDFEMVFDILQTELPKLKTNLETLIALALERSFFDKEDYEVAKASLYYNHVDFECIERKFNK